MIDKTERKMLSVILESCFDSLFYFVIFAVSYMIAQYPAGELLLPTVELSLFSTVLWLMMPAAALGRSLLLFSLGVYGGNRRLRLSREIGRAMLADSAYHVLLLLSLLLLFGGLREFVLIWVSVTAAISLLLTFLKISAYGKARRVIERLNYRLRRIIVVGDSENAELFVRELERRGNDSEMIIGCVTALGRVIAGIQHLGGIGDLPEIIDRHRPTDVVFAKGDLDTDMLSDIAELCEDRCIGIYLIPDTGGFLRSAKQIEIWGSLPLINVHATPLDLSFNAFLKRTVDILGSIFLIILSAPVMLFAAVGVKLSSPGPILFKQKRVGRGGRTFTMLKFRSMSVNSSSDVAWSRDTDARKTRFGSFMRRTAIDELPQLFNVLFGTMSLVGPRPELPHFVNSFRHTVPLYMLKHRVKPGMTGLAQIRGYRGDTSISDRISSDIEYIENWSLRLDIMIILRTPYSMLGYREGRGKKNTDNAMPHGKADSCDTVDGGIKKILYVASVAGHLDNFHTDYISALRRDGYAVKTMARGEGVDYDIPFEKKLISPSNAACRRMIRKILKRERFDALILNTSLAAFHVRLCLPRVGRPRVVNIVHGYLFNGRDRFIKRTVLILAEKLLSYRTDTVITMNRYDEYMAKKKGLCRGRVLFCNGMGVEIIPQRIPGKEIRERYGAEDKYLIVFAGEFSKRKNHKLIIYAMPKILEIIPSAEVWFVGDGALREESEDICRELSLSDSVRFFGHRSDARDLIGAADIYLSPSLSEGMPFNVIEALGCGRTVLATEVKGHTDLLSSGAGVLFDPSSESDMLEKLSRIYRKEIVPSGEIIKQTFLKYSKPRVLDNTYKLIKESL